MVVPQKIKIRITIWSINSTSGYTLQTIESKVSKRHLYIHICSSTIHNSQKVEATQMSIYGWMDEENVVYTTREYYSAKKEGILIYTTTWTNLEDIMLSEIGQSQKDKGCMILFIWDT